MSARLVYPMQVALTAILLLALAATSIFQIYQTIPIVIFGLILVSGTLWLTRYSKLQLASLALIFAMLGFITLLMLAGQGIHDISIVLFPVVLVLSSLLLKRSGYFAVTVLAILIVIGITAAEITGIWVTTTSFATNYSDIVILPALLALTAWVVRVLSGHLTDSLEQSRQLTLHQATLIDEVNRRADYLSTLNQVGAAITSGLDLEHVLSSLYERIQTVAPNDTFSVALYDKAAGELSFPFFVDLGQPIQVEPEEIRDRPGLTAQVIRTRSTLYLPDLQDCEATQELPIVLLGESATRSYLGIPLFLHDEVIGVMSVQSQQPDIFRSDQIRLLETIGNHAAIAIQNARLYAALTSELEERRRVEQALHGRDRILEAVTLAAGKFLSQPNWRVSIREVLQRLGEETRASHAYIYTIETIPSASMDENAVRQAVLIYEWATADITPLMDNPASQRVTLVGDGLEKWLAAMQRGAAFQSSLLTAPPAEAERIQNQKVRSYLNCPIRVNDEFWGYLGFDDVINCRTWTEPETGAIQIAAGLLGAAIQRQRDDAEIRELNTELEGRVRERTADLESFAYSVAHDLRAPLRGIDGYSKLLLDDYGAQLDPEGRGYLTNVRTAAQWMGQLIEDLLKLARVTRVEMRTTEVDLSHLAADILATQQTQYSDRCVACSILPQMTVQGDPNLLRLALDNLLQNAWKFTGRQPQAIIQIGAIERAGERIFYVRDNGIGFDMRFSDKLFTPFQRLHSGEFEGTGIGLATVRRIIQRHSGEIWVDSRPGEGATFYFTLPS